MNPDKKILYTQKLRDIQSKLPPETKLLIVSKTRSIEDIQLYYDLGQRDFGENRVQELAMKANALKESCPDIRWHMIGNLQSNKLNQLFVIPGLWAIHSVDSLELLEKMVKSEHKLKSEVHLFFQVNTSHEEEKSGFESDSDLLGASKLISSSAKLKLSGLMTMGTLRTEHFEAEATRCFKELNQLKGQLEHACGLRLQTSMGMSQDYELAIEEKSHWIRLGTMMFQ